MSGFKHILRGGLWFLLFSVVVGAQRRATDDVTRPTSYSGPNGHVLVVIPGGEFVMGSPTSERGRSEDETQHRVRIRRTYAIATTETTNQQFAAFLAAVPDYAVRWKAATASRFGDPPRFLQYSRTSDSPQVGVSRYDAARYCNWLSERAGIPKDQWVYPESIVPERGLELPADLPAPYGISTADGGGMGVCRTGGDDDQPAFR